MVSLRRRRLLGLCSGKSSFLAPLPRFFDNGNGLGISSQNARPVSVHPMPSDSPNRFHGKSIVRVGPGSSYASGSGSSKEQNNQLAVVEQPIKRRKRHRRKHVHNQEPCLMRGVYFKNMKWQAAIKVDKKQIHLGTVGSQEEAAHLYDRAAFMCGREPNFELPEAEKQELRGLKWEEFLAVTRRAINNKKNKRRIGTGPEKRSESTADYSDWDGKQRVHGFLAVEAAGPDSSA
ncbi:hypothetical protein SLEP1_g606 [Rubroshorea leprosula]|uniref:AP2/ERF domain-containing protein n=1 Tax=Rubroshorea leprosula TaxID=152421 RepID=A0AAV5HB08_9ROSI|nr:hypothetical protein SLEP1_g606 [Rubroshorea leprosula]